MTALRTAVHESASPEFGAVVVFGTPVQRVRCGLGSIALFEPGCVVAYRVRVRRYAMGCVFRTAACAADGGTSVPGVRPPPDLLVGFLRGRRFDRCVALLRELCRRGVVDVLPDEAFLRAATAISRPEFDVALLADGLLEAPWTR